MVLFLGAADGRLWAHFFRVRGCGELNHLRNRALLSPESLYVSLPLIIDSLRGSPLPPGLQPSPHTIVTESSRSYTDPSLPWTSTPQRPTQSQESGSHSALDSASLGMDDPYRLRAQALTLPDPCFLLLFPLLGVLLHLPDTHTHTSGWPVTTCYVGKDDLEHLILLFLYPRF